MSLDTGGSTLEIAIGLAFVFFLLSIVVSAVTEGIARLKDKRAKQLREGLEGMLGKAFADKVREHPLTKNDLGDIPQGKDPSYLSARNFSLALAHVVKDGDTSGIKGIRKGIQNLGDSNDAAQLRRQLQPLLEEAELLRRPREQFAKFLESTEAWYDDTMDRVSGWYKRWTWLVNLVVAAIVAVGLNASAVRIVERLQSDETVRAAVVAGAEKTAQEGAKEEKEPSQRGGEAAETAVKELKALDVPFLWSYDNDPFRGGDAWTIVAAIVGWLITAVAISFGAPFWFDALGKLSRLRTTGKKPESRAAPAA
jgi:hypothetical protein